MTRRGIALAGNWILDRVKTLDVLPERDALANILSVEECNGGSPYNIAVDLVRLGVEFPLFALGLVGDDDAGRRIARHLQSLGVDESRLLCAPGAGTSFTDVMAAGAHRTFFHYRGANALFDGRGVDFSALPSRLLHLGYLLLLDAMDRPDPEFGTAAGRFLARARAAGLRTSVDLVSEDGDRFASVVLPTLPHVDILFANEFELSRTSGVPVGTTPSRETVTKAAKLLFARGLREALFLHTPCGAYAVTASGELFAQPSVRIPEAEIGGVVGAGDAFAAGALRVLHEAGSPRDALRLGVSAAAACITHPTTSGGLRPAAACLQLAEVYGFQPLGDESPKKA